MSDQKPPRLAAGERETVLALLQYQRESLVRKVTGLDAAALRASLVPSGTTLEWLIDHLAEAEHNWIARRFAGLDEDRPLGADAVARYRATWQRVGEIVDRSSLDDLAVDVVEGVRPNLRYILGHLLQETARHAGHADILREQLDGHVGR